MDPAEQFGFARTDTGQLNRRGRRARGKESIIMDLQQLNYLSIIVRILLAVAIGSLIGMERESKNRPAGFRTYTLVSVGACLVMMTNQYMFSLYQSGDPARMGAQVISGVGFLGAGTILVTRSNQVRGLTTAAALWTSACVGLALGIGFYVGALAVGGVLLLVMILFRPLNHVLHRKNGIMRLYAHFDNSDSIDVFLRECKTEKVAVSDMQPLLQKDEEKGGIVVLIEMKNVNETDHDGLVRKFSALQGVRYMEEL